MANSTRFVRLAVLLGALPAGASQAQGSQLLALQTPPAPAGPRAATPQSLEAFLQELKTTYKVSFFYRSQLTEGKYLDQRHPAFGSLAEALRYAQQQSGLQFELLKDGVYVISPLKLANVPLPADVPALLLPGQAFALPGTLPTLVLPPAAAADITVAGRVTQKDGTGLPGVTVVVKGTNKGTTTDNEGNFTLQAEAGNTLAFSYIGYTSQEVPVTGPTTTLAIVLTDGEQSLNEVVVVGYGAQRKEDLTGAVASADLKAFRNQPNTNIAQSLQGTVPGLNVGQVSSAGGNPTIQIRGANTINGNANVLIVLDGIIFTGALSSLNPDDIASIDVLKDASSTAVYGAQAANGVLLITTRQGAPGQKPRVNYQGYIASQSPTVDLRPMNRDQYLQKVRDLYYNKAYLAPDYTTPDPSFDLSRYVDRSQLDANGQVFANDYDWWGNGTRTGHIQNHELSFSGGSEKSSYLLSAGYNTTQGFVKNDDFNRKTVRVNLSTQATPWLKVGTQSFASINDYSGAEPAIVRLIQQSPLLTPYDANGNLIPNPDNTLTPNPFLSSDVNDYDKRLSFFGNFFAEVAVPGVKGLTYRVNFGNNYRNDSHYYASKYGAGLTGEAYKDNNQYYEVMLDNIATYHRALDAKNDLTVTLLHSAIKRDYNHTLASATGFPNLTLGYNSLQQGTIQRNYSDGYNERLNGQMARLNYKYDDRYLFTATIRRDGFSGFATNQKYGVFPSAAVGWIVSKEAFFHPAFVNFLKIRAGYGTSGNLTGRYSSLAQVSSGPAYVFGDGGTTQFGQQVQSLANPNLKWESTRGFNLGVDGVVLNNRLSVTLDLYNNYTNDLLFDVSIPAITGFQSARINVGRVNNKGIELTLTSQNITRGPFTWSTTFNISANRNKIVELSGTNPDGSPADLINNSLFIGRPIRTNYGLQANGLYQLGDTDIPAGYSPGNARIVDANGDGKLTFLGDRTFQGNQEPSYRFSVLNTFNYKGFSLTAFVNSIQGGKDSYRSYNYNGAGSVADGNSVRFNYFSALDYWSPSNPNAAFPRSLLAPALTPNFYQSRNFVRLQDVSLSYHFGKGVTDKLGAQGLSVFASGKNLLTWTNWKGWDPETGAGLDPSRNLPESGGIPRPVLRNYSAGVNVTF